jgi:hypothetical protein
MNANYKFSPRDADEEVYEYIPFIIFHHMNAHTYIFKSPILLLVIAAPRHDPFSDSAAAICSFCINGVKLSFSANILPIQDSFRRQNTKNYTVLEPNSRQIITLHHLYYEVLKAKFS